MSDQSSSPSDLASAITAAGQSGVDYGPYIKQHTLLLKIQAAIAPYFCRYQRDKALGQSTLSTGAFLALFQSLELLLVCYLSPPFNSRI